MKSLLLFFVCFFACSAAFAGDGTWLKPVPINSLYEQDYELYESDQTSGEDSRVFQQYTGYVRLNYNRGQLSDIQHNYYWTLKVQFSYTHNGTIYYDELNINHTSADHFYEDYIAIPITSGEDGFAIDITSITATAGTISPTQTLSAGNITGAPAQSTQLPDDIELILELRCQRVYELNADPNALVDRPYVKFDPSTFRTRWEYVSGAEWYDLEWVFIDKYSMEHDQIAAQTGSVNSAGFSLPFDLKEPTRVRVRHTHFVLDKAYPEGTLYFRVRAVSTFADQVNGLTDNVRTGSWGYFVNSTVGYSTLAHHEITDANQLEEHKTWLYGVTFAEDGKNVSTLTYYDGSNRGRQNLAYNTSDNVTLVSESRFDYEGRPNISIIPAPAPGRNMSWQPDFNMAGTNDVFDEEDFDQTTPVPLATTSGAAKYFSANNDFTGDLFRDAIPDAGGYVYSQTLYRNDGTGRVERAGGIGQEFTANGDHAIQTFYGSTNVYELKRLFGDNVSDHPDGYRKNAVIDANGQLSVTYHDKRGNVIATALAGESPDNLRPIEQDQVTITTPLNDNNIQIDNKLISEHTFISTIPDQVITLEYDLNSIASVIAGQVVQAQNGQNVTFPELCVNCHYKFRVEVINMNGQLVGTALEEEVHPGEECTPAAYNGTAYQVTLGDIGEYRIIKTLEVDQESMDQAFEAELATQGLLTNEAFINTYLETVDFTSCFDDCESYCFATMRLEYIKENGVTAWGAFLADMTKSEYEELIGQCMIDVCTAEDPITPSTTDLCAAMRQQLLHQISPGGVFYEDTGSDYWTDVATAYPSGITIGVEHYSLSELQDPALFIPEMAEELVDYHREYCHLTTCSDWALTNNESVDLVQEAMVATWNSSTTIFATPYTEDDAVNAFGLSSQVQTAVNNYVSNHPIPGGLGTCVTNPSLSGNLFNYVDWYGNRLAEQRVCDGDPLTSDELLAFKKQLFIGLYLQLKQELIKAHKTTNGCITYADTETIFVGAQSQSTMQGLVDGILADLGDPVVCEERALVSLQNWLEQLSMSCLVELGLDSYNAQTNAATLASNYPTPGGTPSLAQLFYNYARQTCENGNNAFMLFYNPDTDGGTTTMQPGEDEYNDIMTLLAGTTNCNYAVLPFEVEPPGMSTVVYANYALPDLVTALNELVDEGFDNLSTSTSTTMGSYPLPAQPFETYLTSVSLSNGFTGYIGIRDRTATIYNPHPHYDIWMAIERNGCVFQTQPIYHYRDYSGPTANVSQTLDFTLETHTVMGLKLEYNSWYSMPSSTDPFTDDPWMRVPIRLLSDCEGGSAGGETVLTDFTPFLDFFTGNNQQETDCIEAEMQQARLDAQFLYDQLIEDLWNDYLARQAQCLSKATEDFKLTYDLKEYQYTLYYYDLAGNLVQTVPPQGVHPFTTTQVDALLASGTEDFPDHEMETRYQYNGLNALVASFTPDGGYTKLYLDELYRVRYSQNARQKDEFKASYMEYDELGRVVEAGEMLIPAGQTGTMDTYLAGLATGSGTEGAHLDYTHTYYEEGYSDVTIAPLFGSGGQQNLRNAIGAVEHRQAQYNSSGAVVAGTAVTTVLSYSYDPHKNVKQQVATNYHLGVLNQQHKSTVYGYDLLSGNVNEVAYQEGETDAYHYRYHYDANNRLVRAFTSKNGAFWEMDAKYFYYLHGPLARVETGNDQVQGTDYAYNLQGWLKGVNSATLSTNRDIGHDGANSGLNKYGGQDVVGFQLGYFTNDYTRIAAGTVTNEPFVGTTSLTSKNTNPDASLALMGSLWNGNISHMLTAICDNNEAQLDVLGSNFQYDQLQRIRETKVYASTGLKLSNIFSNAALYNGFGSEGAYMEKYTFDKNGNLKTLKRNGSGWTDTNGNGIMDAGEAVPLAMDNFVYSYNTQQAGTYTTNPTNSNRLSKVGDDVTAGNYATDVDPGQLADNYTYDKSGQLISDADEGIDEIEWTVTGKVKNITFDPASNKKNLRFIYDAMDRRIAKIQYAQVRTFTYYSYDASGNVLATYERTMSNMGGNDWRDELFLEEHQLYGTKRLGVEQDYKRLVARSFSITGDPETGTSPSTQAPIDDTYDVTFRKVGDKRYELSEHRGNVLAVITDRKIALPPASLIYKNDFSSSISLMNSTGSIVLSPDNDRLKVANADQYRQAYYVVPTIAGHTYRATCTIDLNASGPVTFFAHDYTVGQNIAVAGATSNGTYTIEFTALGSATHVQVQNADPATRTFYLDNFLVEEIVPRLYSNDYSANLNGFAASSGATVTLDSPTARMKTVSTVLYGAANKTLSGLITGHRYRVSYDIDITASGNVATYVRNLSGGPNLGVRVNTTNGTNLSFEFVANGSPSFLAFESAVASTRTFYVDNVIIEDLSVGTYIADVVNYADYSPYGTVLDNRHGIQANNEKHRFGFQGQEQDDEIKGEGNSLNYEYRMHDPRIGRFFAVDPLAPKYPYYTPYQFSGNRPIDCVELEGLEPSPANWSTDPGDGGPNSRVIFWHDWENDKIVTYYEIAPKKPVSKPKAKPAPEPASPATAQATPPAPIDDDAFPGPPMPVVDEFDNNYGIEYDPNSGYPIQMPDIPTPGGRYFDGGKLMSQLAHGVLEGLGYVPGVGEVFDLFNAAIYAAEGDYVNASFSAGSAIPFVGWASNATKYGYKAIKYGTKKADNIIKTGEKAIVIGEGMYRVKPAARSINAKWYQAWSKNFPNGRLMTDAELNAAKVRNARWIKSKINQGYTIYDIGPKGTSISSPFYQLERDIIDKLGYPTTPLLKF